MVSVLLHNSRSWRRIDPCVLSWCYRSRCLSGSPLRQYFFEPIAKLLILNVNVVVQVHVSFIEQVAQRSHPANTANSAVLAVVIELLCRVPDGIDDLFDDTAHERSSRAHATSSSLRKSTVRSSFIKSR